MVQMISSAKGVLALLRETDGAVLCFALKRLVELMDTFWCEIAADVELIEELHESSSLVEDTRKLAALVASQVYFHLGFFDDSVHYALAAGNAFDGTTRSLFTDTILSRCIDQYVEYQEKMQSATEAMALAGPEATAAAAAARSEDASALPKIDPRLETLFVSLTKSWILENERPEEVQEIVGFTIRARRLDFLERVLKQSLARTHSADILNFTFRVASVLLRDITFRRQVLKLLAGLYTESLATVDFFAMTQCLLFLGDVKGTASLIRGLLRGGDKMVAYQLAFDLFEHGNQDFLSALVRELSQGKPADASGAVMGTVVPKTTATDDGTAEDSAAPEAAEPAVPAPQAPAENSVEAKILSVLTGELTTQLHLKFLYARCAADVHVLNQIKKKIDPHKSVVHTATIIANALMYSGTTIDAFLRDNINWMGKAEYWAKFTATAAVGVVHRGHVSESMSLLEPYLPKGGSLSALPFQEAGALYALGLMHSSMGTASGHPVISYLSDNLRKYSSSEQMVHGASLGLGLAAMGLQDDDIFDSLFTCATGSDAVGGEAAALAIGMLMMGSGNQDVIESLRNLANEETQKEKIIRGAVMAMALINLGRENEALELAGKLLESGDPWVRLGGCFVLGLAYAGTENTLAIERLLQITVRDTNDDVRRNAATMVGLLTFENPSLCLDLTRILVDSYNPHIRYGVAMALGVSAAGTGRADVVDVLWEMKDDLADLVRQGVFIALALVMVQLTEAENPKVREFRQLLDSKVGDRKEDACTKFGCIIAAGLLDAGGRNCTLAMHRNRHRLDKAVAGMFLFTQYWYWFPYALMVSLAMQPTCFIGLNDELEMPEYTFKSNAKPSYYSAPKSVLQERREVKAAGVQAVVLSTTRKEEELMKKRGKTGAGAASGAAATASAPVAAAAGDGAPSAASGTEDGTGRKADGGASKGADAEEEAEPAFELLHNPARVTAHQFAVISHDVDERYTPLKAGAMGVCLLKDTKPQLGEQKLVEAIRVGGEEEAPPPAPFAYP